MQHNKSIKRLCLRQGTHHNKKTMLQLHQAGQRAAMEKYGWTIPKFIEEFGRNYL
jgi:hypothetical protein